MSDDKKNENEKLLEEFRKQGKIPGTPESYLYQLLSTAHPVMIEKIEKQAVMYKKMGEQMGKELSKQGKDPNKKAEVLGAMEKILTGLSKNSGLQDAFNMKKK